MSWSARLITAQPGWRVRAGRGQVPGQRCAELVGGPLDGLLLDITGWTQEEIDSSVTSWVTGLLYPLLPMGQQH
ncbi:hypothetical protein [Streptomyces sp. NBC_01363]|uniref:hypothetical protein n=1 Tax=Streptomyces sp. NBC_01363 TaxID=2903840 RepID=UPI002B1E140A|nr:hypothetical protein [Streptomyces sp. NBC_01363]